MAGVRAAVAVVLLLLLAACTVGETTGGRPVPAEPEASAPDPTPASPARPREVRIDGVDPCALLTEEQRNELGLHTGPRLDVGPLPPYPGLGIPLCIFGGFGTRAESVGVSVVTTAGIETFTSGELIADLQATRVAGFPAAIARPTRYTDFCTVVVDVAPGQALDINFRRGAADASIPQAQLCRDAKRAANAAMARLLSLR